MKSKTLAFMVVIIVIIGVVIGYFAYENSLQPNVAVTQAVTNLIKNDQGCTTAISYSFILVNTGSAQGFATVEIQYTPWARGATVTNEVPWTETYLLSAGQQKPISGTVTLPFDDCPTNSPLLPGAQIALIHQTKA